MRRSDNHAALTDEVARFQAEVRRLALIAVREVLSQEIKRKRAKLRPAKQRVEAPPSVAEMTPQPAATTTEQPATTAPPPQEASPPAQGKTRKRVPWTREAIITELASWMSSGTVIDATFVKRYGPPGLVSAARRVFGRFDAALNVAGLHFSKLNPEGPPSR